MLRPDGYDGYECGAPYWILPSGRKLMMLMKLRKFMKSILKIEKDEFV